MGKSMKFKCKCFFLVLSTFIFFPICLPVIGSSDTIFTGQSLFRNQTIISKNGKFELGFFMPRNSSNSYVGIWYRNIPVRTVVWVANRNTPIPDSSYTNSTRLEMSNGNLYLYGNNLQPIWAVTAPTATEAVILDTGNFVLVSNDTSGVRIVWQSFDNPTDTWLPGGRIGFRLFSSTEAKLVSWRNPDNPASGVYSLGMEPNGGSELYISNNGSQRLWRSGAWQGGNFASLSDRSNFSHFTYESRDGTVSVTYNVSNESLLSRIVIDPVGRMSHFVWSEEAEAWLLFSVQPSDFCKRYATCGAYAACDVTTSPVCGCLAGFQPRRLQDWDALDFSGGCVRRVPLLCINGEAAEYTLVRNIKLPANPDLLAVGMLVCRYACSVNCSCNAYAYSGDGGCFLFMGDLLDLERLTDNSAGGDLYIRMNSFTIPSEKGKRRTVLLLGLIVPIIVATLVCACFSRCLLQKRKQKGFQGAHQNILLLDLNGPANNKSSSVGNTNGEGNSDKHELPIFSFSGVATATQNFSNRNKLGEGGFGPVYKGELLNGHFVAVKRLSRRSGQGLEEFRNEIEVIAKLQHTNLVGILGCCIEQDEKILVYEYMPNKSLDFYLFEPRNQELQLDWKRRAQIIEGIAQGLLYLHHYSRLRIIHRDLKASNILLDAEMNPKISDFGMARIFGGKDMQANTKRIVGTYGYMSPEYAMEGIFSIKSDVFAFGVLLLEIISGKKNTGFYGSDYISLLGYAWKLWTKDRAIELIDPQLDVSSSTLVALRYIQVGLLCVQESAADRPAMLDVVAMLSNELTEIASPNRPAFTVGRASVKASPGGGGGKVEICSINDLTLSLMEVR